LVAPNLEDNSYDRVAATHFGLGQNHLFLLPNREGPLQPYLHKAHWIAQSIHPFINIQRIFYAGTPEAIPDDETDISEE
jgi:hypothetical protein